MTTQLHISPCADLIPEIAPVQNDSFGVKPKFGLWTSSYLDGKSAWVDAYQDMFGHSGSDVRALSAYSLNWFLLEPDPAARVLVIDTMADLRRLVAKFPARQEFGTFCRVWPDFERISEHYDAMQLTENGQWRTRMPIEPNAPNLYGWDAESTVWFRWCFTGYRRIEAPQEVKILEAD